MSIQTIDQENGLFLITASRPPRLIPCRTYLITEGDSAVLIDPGPEEDFAEIFSAVTSRVGCGQISCIILTSELPEGASSLALWERAGFSGRVAVTWQSYIGARYYAPGMDFFSLSGRNSTINIGGRRSLQFIPAPGYPTAGAQVCWDEASGTLFSGKLFGSIMGGTDPAELSGLGRICSYHDIYFASPLSEKLKQSMEGLPVKRICPQHGDLLNISMAELFTGLGLTVVEGAVVSQDFQRSRIAVRIFQRLATLFSEAEALFAFGNPPDENSGMDEEEFSAFFAGLLQSKGYTWLGLMDAELRRLCSSSGVNLPDIYRTHEKEIAGGLGILVKEIKSLKESNFQLQHSIIKASDDLIRDSISGLYNESFFNEYVSSTFQGGATGSDSVIIIRLDGIKTLNGRFGAEAVDITLKALASFLMNRKKESGALFRLNGPAFACYQHDTGKDVSEEYARQLQKQVELSHEFIAPVTVSAAIVGMKELIEVETPAEKIFNELMKTVKERIKILERLGPGSICTSSKISHFKRLSGSILLIESNEFEARIYRRILEAEGFEVNHVMRGIDAISEADRVRPDAIISEIFVAQMDGFQIRRALLDSQDLKAIPFILISREKSEASIRRAQEMQIMHHFRKPVIPVELTGTLLALIDERNRTQ